MEANVQAWRDRLKCSLPKVDDIFEDCLSDALQTLSVSAVEQWIDGASKVNGLGRGTELVLIFLEDIPEVVRHTDESVIPEIADMAETLSRNASGPAINPFLSTLPAVARRLNDRHLLQQWFHIVSDMADQAREGLVPLLERSVFLLNQLSIGSLRNWVDAGIRGYQNQPHRISGYFSLETADAHAMLQRERHGTLYMDHERQLKMLLRAMWETELDFRPFSVALEVDRKPVIHLDMQGIHLPDVYDDLDGVSGLDRYRALIAHIVAHHLWTEPMLADNYSTFQHVAIEIFEDSRVEQLAIGKYPGLRKLWMQLHPAPEEGACPEGYSAIRHHLAMISRAIMDPDHGYTDPVTLDFARRFRERFEADPNDQSMSTDLGVAWLSENYVKEFRLPRVWFENTVVTYRDDNRYLWLFLEAVEEETEFHSDHGTKPPEREENGLLPPQHYAEWDYMVQTYRPDWVTVYERIQQGRDASTIDALLEKHQMLAKRLKQIVDLLKPQQRKRIRYQEEGDELDLDVLISAMIDYRAGSIPDARIYQNHVKDGRDISVLLLLDLSQSIEDVPEGLDSSILQLSQEAVSLLAWAVEALGDPFAIAGFASNTRHEVRYTHFKSFNESWGDEPKARLAAMEAGYSTRMGAALRHAGRYMEHRKEEKKLILLLTDGEPSDIDVQDERYLKDDTHEAVGELASKGISTYCISLDPHADDYVANIFGRNNFTVIDRVERLPEKLPQLFMSLTN